MLLCQQVNGSAVMSLAEPSMQLFCLQDPASTAEQPKVDPSWLSNAAPSLVVAPEALHLTDAGPVPATEVCF